MTESIKNNESYVHILINKSLLKNKNNKNFKNQVYVIDDFYYINKKSPNAFIIFRNSIYKKIKNENLNLSSREISVMIGKTWKDMAQSDKLSYLMKAKEMKDKNDKLRKKFRKFIKLLN